MCQLLIPSALKCTGLYYNIHILILEQEMPNGIGIMCEAHGSISVHSVQGGWNHADSGLR